MNVVGTVLFAVIATTSIELPAELTAENLSEIRKNSKPRKLFSAGSGCQTDEDCGDEKLVCDQGTCVIKRQPNLKNDDADRKAEEKAKHKAQNEEDAESDQSPSSDNEYHLIRKMGDARSF